MGVDYVYGKVESTGGALWVVGNDPVLFDYFLPEKWRKTARSKLSPLRQVYHTITKDSIKLVWQVSRVGRQPDVDRLIENRKSIIAHGYNSPFEEISLSMELSRNGIETTYPRAVYMTGRKSRASTAVVDNSRYDNHRNWRTPDGHPILSKYHDYVTIWGYWNGPDEILAVKDDEVYRGINALDAWLQGLITEDVYLHIMQTTADRMKKIGIDDLTFAGNHLLLSLDRSGRLARDRRGMPMVRICNFELLRHDRSSDILRPDSASKIERSLP